jgi:hypothetical protein
LNAKTASSITSGYFNKGFKTDVNNATSAMPNVGMAKLNNYLKG